MQSISPFSFFLELEEEDSVDVQVQAKELFFPIDKRADSMELLINIQSSLNMVMRRKCHVFSRVHLVGQGAWGLNPASAVGSI